MSIKNLIIIKLKLCEPFFILILIYCYITIISAQEDNNIITSNSLEDTNKNEVKSSNEILIRSNKDHLICPGTFGTAKPSRYPLFALNCEKDSDCVPFFTTNDTKVCCLTPNSKQKRCIEGVLKPIQDYPHPAFFGIIQRRCPIGGIEAFGELISDIKECKSDNDCWPLRICCPDSTNFNGKALKKFCRAPYPMVENYRIPLSIKTPIKNMLNYLQCTKPPPAALDLFPKPCRNTFDCFPNLCCQEKEGKRYCRPPKKSLLALVAGFTQRVGASYRDRVIAKQPPLEDGLS